MALSFCYYARPPEMPSDVHKIRTQNMSGGDLVPRRTGLVDATGILRHLDRLQRRVSGSELAVLRLPAWAVDWASFPPPSCSLPGADIGQIADYRYTVGNGTGLHLQGGLANGIVVIDAHLDPRDGCTRPIEHALEATCAVEYAAVGAFAASVLAYILRGSGKAVARAALLGAGGGALAGAHVPKQRRVVFALAMPIGAQGWSL